MPLERPVCEDGAPGCITLAPGGGVLLCCVRGQPFVRFPLPTGTGFRYTAASQSIKIQLP
eukprot:gene20027-biopygen13067